MLLQARKDRAGIKDVTDVYPEVAGWYYVRHKLGPGNDWALAYFGPEPDSRTQRWVNIGECFPVVMPNAEGEVVITSEHAALIEKGARLTMQGPRAFLNTEGGGLADLDSPDGIAELRRFLTGGLDVTPPTFETWLKSVWIGLCGGNQEGDSLVRTPLIERDGWLVLTEGLHGPEIERRSIRLCGIASAWRKLESFQKNAVMGIRFVEAKRDAPDFIDQTTFTDKEVRPGWERKDSTGKYYRPSLRVAQLINARRKHPEDQRPYTEDERFRGILEFLDEVHGGASE